jgi:hypothetical protein
MDDASMENNVLTGFLSVTFKPGDEFNTFCSRLAGYNVERFEAVALRFFSGEETIITIFAADKMKMGTSPDGHLPVHKFKIQCSLDEFFREIRQMNFTISTTKHDMWEMEVVNK